MWGSHYNGVIVGVIVGVHNNHPTHFVWETVQKRVIVRVIVGVRHNRPTHFVWETFHTEAIAKVIVGVAAKPFHNSALDGTGGSPRRAPRGRSLAGVAPRRAVSGGQVRLQGPSGLISLI